MIWGWSSPCAGRVCRAVLGDLDAKLTKLPEYLVGGGALGPGRARDLAEPHEAVEHPLVVAHRPKAMPLAEPLT